MRKLLGNNQADLNMILGAIVVAITLAISVIIVWNVVAAVDPGTIDSSVEAAIQETSGFQDVTNSTDDLNTNIETFYTVAPIVLIVMAAVGILGYVLLLRRT